MNGRLYDPLVGRFLSADPVIQYGANTQNYNRYSYCLNNPLKFTDPSGYQIRKSDADAWAEAMTDRNDFFMINSGGGSGVGPGASTPHIYRMRQESIAQDASGGWRYDESTGTYSNIFTGESGWDNAFNSLQQSDRILERYGMAQTAYIENGRKIGNGDYYWVRLGHGVESTGLYPTFTRPVQFTDGNGIKSFFNYTNDVLNAFGIAAGGAELFTEANAGTRIFYTTINGTSACVSSSKVVSTLKAVGTYTVVGSVFVDLTLGTLGYQTPGKTITNIGIGIGTWAIGGIPGIVIGVGYTVLDKTGMLDRPYLPHYTPPSFAMPDATRVAPTTVKY